MAIVSHYGKARGLVNKLYPDALTAVQPKANWMGEKPLPGEIADMYASFGPVDLRLSYYPADLTVPQLRKLWGLQAGYAFDGATGELYANWPENWTVVGRAGDECIYVFNEEDGKVHQAKYKRLRWKSKPVWDSLGEYCVTVVALSKVCKELGPALVDADGKLTPDAADKALLELFELMGRDIDRAEGVLVRMGWLDEDED
ncbi:MAG: hypothetical protein VX899_12360 [Myxococcota bacterium]|nr:hypothetical protein [Myxococcota bacterium]